MPTVGHTIAFPSAAAAAGLAGTTHGSGLPLPSNLSDRSSPYTKLEQAVRVAKVLYDRVLHMMQFHCEPTATAREVAVLAGTYTKANGTQVSFSGGTLTLPNNATRKVYIDVATNTLTATSLWPATEQDYVPIAEVTTADGAVTAIEDRRDLLRMRIMPSIADTGATDFAEFVTDNDNAGPEADGGIRHNRGSSAGDAALRWIAASTLWRLFADVDATDLAKLDLLEVLIGGTSMITSDGAAKVQSGVAGNGLAHASGVLTPDVDDSTVEVNGSNKIAVKDAGVDAAKLNTTLRESLPYLVIPDAAGSASTNIDMTLHVEDRNGDDYADVHYFAVGVYDDEDGAALSANATISVTGAGSSIVALTAGKELLCKTDASGDLGIRVNDGGGGTFYVIARPHRRSRAMNFNDYGTVTIS